jgi:hypothetical protein
MKYLVSFLLLFCGLSAFSQADTIFVLGAEFGATTEPTDSTFTVDIIHPTDQLGQAFTASKIQVGYRLIDVFGRLYRVKSVDATGIGSSTLTVVELQDAAGPSGTGLVYRKPDNSDCIPEIQTGDIGISYALAARIANHNAAVGCGGGITAIEYFDILQTGQSNAFNRDNVKGAWTYVLDNKIYAVQSDSTLEVANPALDNIITGDTNTAPNEERNNTAWAFAKQVRAYNTGSTVRIAAHATGGRASYYWTPETTGPGELSASNSLLENTLAKLNAAPSDFAAKVCIWQQGENDASENIMNTYLNRIESIYDTLAGHPKVSDNFVMLLCYPDNSNTAYDSLRLSLDSVYYQTRDFGNRNIIAVKYELEGFDNIHFTNEQQELIGKYGWSAYQKGLDYNALASENVELWTDESGVTTSVNPISVTTSATVTNTTGGSVYPINASKENDSEILRVSRNAVGGARFQGFDIIGGSSTNSSGGFWLDYLNNSSGSYAHRNMLRFHNTGVLFQGPSYGSAMGVFYEPDSVHVYGPLRMNGNFRTAGNAIVDGNLTVTGTTTLGTVLSATFTSISISGTNSTPFNIERPTTHRARTLVGSSTNSSGGILYSYENWNGSSFVVDNYFRRYVGGFAFEKADGADVLTINTSSELITASSAVNAVDGFRVNGAATSGQYLRGNGTNFVSSAIVEADLPARPATDITIADAGEYFTGSEAEAVTQEIGLSLSTNVNQSNATQSGTGTPVGSVTPVFVGQHYIDTTTPGSEVIWFAVGLANTNWVQLN